MPHRVLQPKLRNNREIAAGPQQIGAQLDRRGDNRGTRQLKSPSAESAHNEWSERVVRGRKRPWLIHQLGKIDAAPFHPRVLHTRGDDIGALEKKLEPHLLVFEEVNSSENQKVDLSVEQ